MSFSETEKETGEKRSLMSLMRERQKVPLGPSSDLAPVKSISVTPGSQT